MAICKGHRYRIVVSDLLRGEPVWFGGIDRSGASLDEIFSFLGPRKTKGVHLAMMDRWKLFRKTRQRLKPYEKFAEMIERHYRRASPPTAFPTTKSHSVSSKDQQQVPVQAAPCYGLRDEEYLCLKVLTCRGNKEKMAHRGIEWVENDGFTVLAACPSWAKRPWDVHIYKLSKVALSVRYFTESSVTTWP